MKFKPSQKAENVSQEWMGLDISGNMKCRQQPGLTQESFTTDRKETSLLQAAAWQGGNMALRKADMSFMLLMCEAMQSRTQRTRRDYLSKARKHKRTFIMHCTE